LLSLHNSACKPFQGNLENLSTTISNLIKIILKIPYNIFDVR
jgi:hypothetical protein